MIYRALKALPPRGPHDTEPAATKGQLLFPWKASRPKLEAGQVALTVSPNGWGGLLILGPDEVEPLGQPMAGDFLHLLQFYLEGHAPLPNARAHDPSTFCRDLDAISYAGGPGMIIGRRAQLEGFQPAWCTAWCSVTQRGALDGRGLVIFNLPPWGGNKGLQRFASFSLCEHEPVAGASANPSRGWHPARCRKCGLDLTVDSSD